MNSSSNYNKRNYSAYFTTVGGSSEFLWDMSYPDNYSGHLATCSSSPDLQGLPTAEGREEVREESLNRYVIPIFGN